MNSNKWWHRPRPSGVLDFGHNTSGTTQYVDEYKEHRVLPAPSFKPNEVIKSSGEKVSDRTTFRIDYVPHPLTLHEPRPPETYKPPDKAMEGLSMYRQDYPGHKTGRIQLARRKDGRTTTNAKFEANPTYTSDYKRWMIPPRVKVGPEYEYKKPEVKMESISTFQKDFVARHSLPPKSAKPPDVAFQSQEPLDNNTIHKLNFVPHPLEARARREKPVYVAPTVPMNDSTTFKRDFRGLKATPAQSMKPTQSALQSKEPLATSSEFRDRFVAWPVNKPKRHESLKYIAPEGNIDLQTTQRVDFRALDGKPALPVKPANKLTKSLPFDGTTNYNTDFKRWQMQRNLVKPKNEYVQGEGKFDGLSTTRLHYISHPGNHMAKSCKPGYSVLHSENSMDDRTIYKTSYIPQSMAQCERYPTPDWLKYQENAWERQGLLSRGGAVSVQGGKQLVNVAA